MDVKTEEYLAVLSGSGKAANSVPDGAFSFAAPELEDHQGGVEPSCGMGDEAFREA